MDKVLGRLQDRLTSDFVAGAPGRTTGRLGVALAYGTACHLAFAVGVGAMMVMMGFGMSRCFGTLPSPWSWIVNGLLLAQFPILHSGLLSRGGQRLLRRLAPSGLGGALLTTTYALLASLQTGLLFTAWTPSGTVWWRAGGPVLVVILTLYAMSWLLLLKAIIDAGAALQTGLLGWWAVARGRKPTYPPMPERGLFRLVRQPIYVAFTLTVWTVPVWSPDQLAVATVLTGYCLIGPLFKEARFRRLFGDRFRAYAARVPYWLPRRPTG